MLWFLKLDNSTAGDTVEQNGGSSTTTTVSPIGPDELPPPYSTVSGGVPMVSCRVCGNMIDISGKKDQVLPTQLSLAAARSIYIRAQQKQALAFCY